MDGQSKRTFQTLENILRACVLDFGGNWDQHLPHCEFTYNNKYYSSISMILFEALCDRSIQSLVCWNEVGNKCLPIMDYVQKIVDKIVVIRKYLITEPNETFGVCYW